MPSFAYSHHFVLQRTKIQSFLTTHNLIGRKEFIGFKNYETLFLVKTDFLEAFQNTLVYTGTVPVNVFPVADGKTGVRISDRILVLHSPTQKQLAEFLNNNEPPSAPEVVLSQRNLEDETMLSQALDAVGAERILVQAGFKDILTQYAGRPVESPYWIGEIVRQFTKE